MLLETPRLLVRTPTLDDADFYLTLLNQPSWIENIGDRGVRTLEQARAYIEDRMLLSHRNHGFGLCVVLLKTDNGAALPIGTCGILRREGLDAPDLGFAMLDAYAGQGYAYKASLAVLEDGWARLRLARVLAITVAANVRSQRLLVRLGFAEIGTTQLPNDPEPLCIFERVQPA